MKNEAGRTEALRFMREETEFQLGFLPTEQSHPETKELDRLFAESCADGVRNLQSVDRDVETAARRILGGAEFARMVSGGIDRLANGGKIVFSGCGATGRLSILLEAMWRKFFLRLARNGGETGDLARYADRVESIMTGGDHALIRSVENFEDYAEFGREQVREAGLSAADMLVAITEGGETSSVLGTVDEALARGARVFLLFNNPREALKRIERSRRAIEDPRVTVLELYSGPMAVAGSTRMQAVTFELLVAGAALEQILVGTLPPVEAADDGETTAVDHAAAFGRLLNGLESRASVAEMAAHIDFEARLYARGGRVTYFADGYLLDILTDTTERAPTFALPPFRKRGDTVSPPSWAFVKNPLHGTEECWRTTLGRAPRCLRWTAEDYRRMGAAERIAANPPKLDDGELARFAIGNEPDESRLAPGGSAAILVAAASETREDGFAALGSAFDACARPFPERRRLIVGRAETAGHIVPAAIPESPLLLFEHLAAKLVLNTVSTGTMAKMGRVSGNWMSHVEMTNKKLIDRSVRLISELCGLSYEDACVALFESKAEMTATPGTMSPVQYVIGKLGRRKGSAR